MNRLGSKRLDERELALKNKLIEEDKSEIMPSRVEQLEQDDTHIKEAKILEAQTTKLSTSSFLVRREEPLFVNPTLPLCIL